MVYKKASTAEIVYESLLYIYHFHKCINNVMGIVQL